LRDTLIAWAAAREDYLVNTTVLISRIAPNRPDSIDPTDTSNLLWAATGRRNDSGHGARTFAQVNPCPPIEWFDEFHRRDIESEATYEAALRALERHHSDVRPTSPSLNIRPLFLIAGHDAAQALSDTNRGLINWLVRHLGNAGLIRRVVERLERGARLHPEFRRAIRSKLDEVDGLAASYGRFWRIVSAEGHWNFRDPSAAPAWNVAQTIRTQSQSGWIKRETLAALRPSIQANASRARFWREMSQDSEETNLDIRDVADLEIVLADEDRVTIMVDRVNARDEADEFWSELLEPLASLLNDVLELYETAGIQADPSLHRPSIAPHEQNRHQQSWTILFDLIWRGWLHVDRSNAQYSRALVSLWRQSAHPAFRRMAIAAMNWSGHFTAAEKADALVHG
jgi:hypothetical protein